MITNEPETSNWRTVYATVKDRNGDDLRIGATIYRDGDTDGNDIVMIHMSNGGWLGGIRLDSLKDSKLTAANLRDYFAQFNNGSTNEQH